MNQKLLVEGSGELHVFQSLFKKHNVAYTFDVDDKKGIDNLLTSIPIEVKSDLNTLGIVIDKDFESNSKWGKLKNILVKDGYTIPDLFPLKGLIVEHGNLPKLGVWIMPDNQSDGMLEDFVSYMISEDDTLINKVKSFLDEIESVSLNEYIPNHRKKAEIYTWLSCQEDPGTPMGLAITKKYLDPENNLTQDFIEWINKLFNS